MTRFHWPVTPRHANLRPIGAAWTLVLLFAGAATMGFGLVSGRSAEFGFTGWAAVCAAPAVIGAALALTSTADRQQYVARGLAAALFGPIGLAMWAGTADGPSPASGLTWATGLGALALTLAAWLGLLAWVARVATRLEPPTGAAAADWALLQTRLAALANPGGPIAWVTHGARDVEAVLAVDPAGRRGHRVALQVDPASRTVHVVERLTADGAPPLAGETSFHRPGDPLIDPVRPSVQRVSGRVRQTTMLDAEALAGWPLDPAAGTLSAPGARPGGWAAADAEDRGRMAVALLAAVVVGSGWTWQPALWAGRAAARDR